MALLEGLEVSEVLLSELYPTLRIDAETYQPFYMDIENAVLSKQFTTLGEISKVFRKGIFDIKSSVYSDTGVPFARISNLKKMGISTDDIVYIPKEENDKNLNTFLSKGDVILSKTATPAASIVQIENCNTSQDTVAIKLKKQSGLDSGYLVPYLNSKYGFFQMQRWFTGNIQMHLNLTDGKGIFVHKPSAIFQEVISNKFWESFRLNEQYQESYSQAEDLLLKSLNFEDFEPSQSPTNIKNFSDSFGKSGRLDAEYYQVKYEQVVSKIEATNHERLADIVKIKKSIEPGSANYTDKGLPFVRVADYNKFGLSTPDKYLTDEFCKEKASLIEKLKPKKETILFTKDGTVGTAYMLRKDADFITSGAILHLTVKDKSKIIPEYLTLVLNSRLVQKQAERDAGGSIILHWRVGEIENVIVPIIDFDEQKAIANLVEESFQLKKQSEHLLEVAKRAVEIAIEEDERAALGYIETETASNNLYLE